jgi:hypothetical protein
MKSIRQEHVKKKKRRKELSVTLRAPTTNRLCFGNTACCMLALNCSVESFGAKACDFSDLTVCVMTTVLQTNSGFLEVIADVPVDHDPDS